VSRPAIEPGHVWFVDFEPVRGREQGKDRPALVVSSRFHLDLTMGHLVSVLPLTTIERRGWMHRVHVATGGGWVITEQIRTVSADRFRRFAPEITLSSAELNEVRRVLGQMLITSGSPNVG
jgi:mRNA interferase MazF